VSFRSALLADLPLKLTSVFLSVFLWFLAAGEEPGSALLEVDVTVRPPPGRTILRPPEALRALVTGPRRDLLRLSATPVRLTRILPDTMEGDQIRLDLAPGELEIPSGVAVRVQDLQPRSVTVELDSTTQRVVPVEPIVSLRPDLGFSVQGISVVPGTVRLFGPVARLKDIDSIRTEALEVTSADAPLERDLGLDTTGLGMLRIEPRVVTVRVEIEASSERTIENVPVGMPSALAGSLRPSLEVVRVRVRGPVSRLAGLLADSLVVIVNPGGRASPGRVGLRVLLPQGITGEAEPDSVDLVRRSSRG
jgi:YbbR-like protein